MNAFDYDSYKVWVNDWIEQQPRGGHGQLRKMAEYLEINSVVMSQVFRGDRDLTLEQSLLLTKYMGTNEMERDYFLLLVQRDRAGHHELKKVFTKQIESIREASRALKNRVKHQKFTDEDRATFYSAWHYSAVRLAVSIPRLNSPTAIADYLDLDRLLVAKVLEFLSAHKLVVEKNGKLDMGPQITHLGHDSPFIKRHHTNWRLKALQAMEKQRSNDLFYSGAMALSDEAAEAIRKLVLDLVEKATKKAAPSESETLRCLNIDWFGVARV